MIQKEIDQKIQQIILDVVSYYELLLLLFYQIFV